MEELKKCVICKWLLPLSDFNLNRTKKDGLQIQCRECGKVRDREYYLRNKEKHRKITTVRRRMARERSHNILWEYLSQHPCVDCGENDPIVLQFDHVRGKKFAAVAALVGDGHAWHKISEEIKKCDVRCANCHLRRTSKERGQAKYHISQEQSMNK